MTYKQAEQYIYSLISRKVTDGKTIPARMTLLLEKLDNPQNDVRIIHVAGTSGKGSTVTLLASILTESGYNTGSYTSPHVVDLRERIQINQALITKSVFLKLVERVAEAIKTLNKEEIFPTYFEVLFAISLLYFRDQNVDAAVIETGIGGTNDATSVITPILSVITSVGLDHTDKLGNTLSKIAGHKAGIIKLEVPVVSGVIEEEAKVVINQKAKDERAPILNIGDEFGYEVVTEALNSKHQILKEEDKKTDLLRRSSNSVVPLIGFEFWTVLPRPDRSRFEVGMRGSFQAHNGALAIQSALLLSKMGFGDISDSSIQTGLQTARIPGRMEFINTTPFTILDVAHSVPKIKALVTSYCDLEIEKATVIFACGNKTNYKEMLCELSTISNNIIITEFETKNGPQIARHVNTYSVDGEAWAHAISFEKDPQKAIAKAKVYGAPILVTGSVFFISAIVKPM